MRVLISAFILIISTVSASAETLYLTAGTMIDVLKGRVVKSPAIVITDGRITAVGKSTDLKQPDNAAHIDLGDNVILPGLIDMHTHITSHHDVHGFRRLSISLPRALQSRALHRRARPCWPA